MEVLLLFSIPEAFLRRSNPSMDKYADGLKQRGVTKLSVKDTAHYATSVSGKNLSEVFHPLPRKCTRTATLSSFKAVAR